MEQFFIRNFCIIAHIDHGKSTLADRFLELTGTIPKREMKEQFLDQMDIERERGITIKLQPVRMKYRFQNDDYILNLIDTPGHVDFTYEVTRSLAAVEGAILLVDATQGVQAQTVANLYLARKQNLAIIPVINKIDLPNAQIERTQSEICQLLACQPEEIILISAKTGQNVLTVLATVIKKVPPPAIQKDLPLRSLIFDSTFDDYQGVIASVRVKEGQVRRGDRIKFMANRKEVEVSEVGYFLPKLKPTQSLAAGEIGYIVTGLKNVSECRVGDTLASLLVQKPLPGYQEVKPMVFAGLFPKVGDQYLQLREAIEKLKLNDAALFYEPENSKALGFGFRCGFLGLLHLEIVQERLRREFGLELVVTVPSVGYKVILKNGRELTVKSPQDLPDLSQISQILEPIMKAAIFCPKKYLGAVMTLAAERRGEYLNTEYLSSKLENSKLKDEEDLAVLRYEIPLATLILDFYDKLKSVTSGYASLNYEFYEFRPAKIIKLSILVAEESVEALSTLVYEDEAYRTGRRIVESLKENLPKQMFVVKIQAALGGKVIAAERLSALRKDVTAKLYGGDYTRKRKLLEKQKKGKKKMMVQGRGTVDIPPETYLAVLKR